MWRCLHKTLQWNMAGVCKGLQGVFPAPDSEIISRFWHTTSLYTAAAACKCKCPQVGFPVRNPEIMSCILNLAVTL